MRKREAGTKTDLSLHLSFSAPTPTPTPWEAVLWSHNHLAALSTKSEQLEVPMGERD